MQVDLVIDNIHNMHVLSNCNWLLIERLLGIIRQKKHAIIHSYNEAVVRGLHILYGAGETVYGSSCMNDYHRSDA